MRMKTLTLKPDGWPCTLIECPSGHFLYKDEVGFKSKYGNNEGHIEAFCETGEMFWAGTSTHEDRHKVIVQPLIAEWEYIE